MCKMMKWQWKLRLRVGGKTLALFSLCGLYGPVKKKSRELFHVSLWKQKWRAMESTFGAWSSVWGRSAEGEHGIEQVSIQNQDEWHILFPGCRENPDVGKSLPFPSPAPISTHGTMNSRRDTQQGQTGSTSTEKCGDNANQITLGFLNGTCLFLFKKCCSFYLNGTL